MDNNDDKRQQLLLDIMNHQGAATPPDAAGELLLPWQRLSAHLSPLIGDSGFCALYVRATRLAAAQFDWLSANPSCKSMGHALASLGDAFVSVEPAVARAANAALLNTFTKLLADLIGEALTIRLLHAATQGVDQRMNAQEHK